MRHLPCAEAKPSEICHAEPLDRDEYRCGERDERRETDRRRGEPHRVATEDAEIRCDGFLRSVSHTLTDDVEHRGTRHQRGGGCGDQER